VAGEYVPSTEYTYDALDRLAEIAHSDGSTASLGYRDRLP
jgi:hypothetical protein